MVKIVSYNQLTNEVYKKGVNNIMEESEIKRKKVISVLKIILIFLVLLLLCTCFYKDASYRSQVIKHIEKVGDNPTQNQIDEMFISGQYIYGEDPESAKLYFERVVEYEPRAAYYLSDYYNTVKKDDNEYLKWLINAAERGVSDAQYNLGVHYDEQNNEVEAEKWYLKAAEQGNVNAQYNLGVQYFQEKKLKESENYFLKAAEQNDGRAQYNLGVQYYREGRIKESEIWFLKAAEKNNSSAQYNLGVIYYENNQIDKARIWYQKASNQGHKNAKEELKKIEREEK